MHHRQAVLGVLACLWLAPAAARATVAEQRARLPPPAQCQDPAEGIWRAHQFEERRQEWYIFTLEVRRPNLGSPELTGTILSEYWSGTSKEEQPPPCEDGQYRRHHIVRMPAVGTLNGADVAFGGTSYSWVQDVCNTGHGRYNPDRFTGQIDPALQEFQSVNNDGGAAVNVPTVFRRIRCWDDSAPPAPNVTLTPPPLFRDRKRAGCQCALGARPAAPRRGWPFAMSLAAAAGARRRMRAQPQPRPQPQPKP